MNKFLPIIIFGVIMFGSLALVMWAGEIGTIKQREIFNENRDSSKNDVSCEDIEDKIYSLMDKIKHSSQIDIRDLYSNEVLAWKTIYDMKECD